MSHFEISVWEVIEKCAKDKECYAVHDVLCESPSIACAKPEEEIENKFCMCTLENDNKIRNWIPLEQNKGGIGNNSPSKNHYKTFNGSLPKDLKGCVYVKSKHKISNIFCYLLVYINESFNKYKINIYND